MAYPKGIVIPNPDAFCRVRNLAKHQSYCANRLRVYSLNLFSVRFLAALEMTILNTVKLILATLKAQR